jgi:glucose/arabinose dehydrogenase
MKGFIARSWEFIGVLAAAFFCALAQAQLPQFISTNAFPGVNFSQPVCIAVPPGETNRLFVLEKNGVIAVITNLVSPTRSVFMDISSRVNPSGEGGLLGLAFHPGYESNRLFYIYYTGSATNGTSGFHDILARFQTSAADPNQGDTNSEVRLIAQYDEADNHNGGDVHFGSDGYLYLSLGDEGGGNDSFNNSQRIDKDFFSGILRLDVDKRPGSLAPNAHVASSTNYAVPPDNPFVGAASFNGSAVNPANVRTEFWAVGLRNPWRYSFDPPTGIMYCGDVGQDAWEEVDIITKGGNYGWAYREATHAGPKSPPGGFMSIDPIVEYAHGSGMNQGNCVIGGVVYRGNRFGPLIGYYFYADYISGNVWALTYDGANASAPQRLFSDAGIVAFGTDPSNGDILCANLNNADIERIVTPAPPGSLQVTIDPPGAVTSGAMWRVNGGAFRSSGATVAGLAPGNQTVSFKTVPGWKTPKNLIVKVESDSTTVTNGTYISTDVTRPTLTIASPKSGLRVSNDVFTATGTAKDNVAVAEVWYQLNDDAPILAAGTTNWTAAALSLQPGGNTLAAYAVDTSGNFSKTNLVNFFFATNSPVLVQIVGSGTVSPDYNGQLLEIGKSYTMIARPAKGFALAGWSLLNIFEFIETTVDNTGSNSITTTNIVISPVPPAGGPRLNFVMYAPELIYYATNGNSTTRSFGYRAVFVDAAKPVTIVTFPAANKTVTNALLNVTGKASDNVGVTSVEYQLNGTGWYPASSTNNWTNWLASGLVPNAGGNLIQAWAADVAGNISKTNSVKFVYQVVPSADWAPDTLSGLIATAAPDTSSPTHVSFDALTFSQAGATTNDDFSVGTYAYLKTGTNTAQLSLTNSAPPTMTNNSANGVALIFTNHYRGIFTNDEGAGTISFAIGTNRAPVSASGKRIMATGPHGSNAIMLMSNGHFTLTPSISGAGMSSAGTWSYRRYSPDGSMLVLTFTGTDAGTVVYVQLTFTAPNAGSTFVTVFGGLGNVTDLEIGTFVLR